jgi:23S rRNA (guanosine2251-2'-O)-methyltransferase
MKRAAMKRPSQNHQPVPIWGIHPVREFLRACPDAVTSMCVLPSFGNKPSHHELLTLAKRQGVKPLIIQDFNRQGLTPGAVHQGVMAQVMPVWSADIAELHGYLSGHAPLVVACDQVTDPQNLGAIMRSCAVFGAQAVVVPSRGSPPLNGVVIKASSGAAAHIKVCEAGNLVRALAGLKDMGLWVVGLSPEAKTTIWDVDLSVPVCLVAGAEGEGLRHLVKQTCDIIASIPQHSGIASLNVASATSVFLYEAARQRHLMKVAAV